MVALKTIIVVLIDVFCIMTIVMNSKLRSEMISLFNKNSGKSKVDVQAEHSKKNKILYLVFLSLLVLFTVSLVNKTMQNDTFFYIPIGEHIAQTHTIDGFDHWSFHENLKFTYPRLDLQFNHVFLISFFWF